MTSDDAVAGGSRSRWLRLPPRPLLISILLVVLLGIGAVVLAIREVGQPRYGAQAEMIAELQGLVGDNGLFMRPGLTSDGDPSWAASAYGAPALAAASGQKPSLPNPEALRASLDAQVRAEPIWGRWYASMVERSTGATLPGDWATEIVTQAIPTGDAATRIAAVAAITDVANAKALPIPAPTREAFAAVLDDAGTAGPYTQCRALQAADALDLDLGPGDWSIPPGIDLTLPANSDPTVAMDAYGRLCLATQLGEPLDEPTQQRVRRWLQPQLDMDVAGAEFETYFVVQGWLAAGGDRASLDSLTQRLRDRVDPGTGLLRERVVRLGTLESTYYVAVLAETVDAFDDISGKRTLTAVQDLLPRLRAATLVTDLLMAAVVLRYADKPDEALEAEAVGAARRWLAGGITRDNVVMAARTIMLLQQLGRDVPRTHAAVFPVAGAEDRYLAWTLLGIAHHLDNGDAVRDQMTDAAAQTETALNNPDPLLVKEASAAVTAAGADLDRNDPPQPLTQWAQALQGCDGFRTLYRPVLSESRCSLEATVQMINIGLTTA